MSKELAVINPATITRLDEIAQTYQLAKVNEAPFSAAISTALAIGELRSLLTPEVMRPIMALMNTPLGFLTDRTGRPNWKGEIKPLYTEDIVRDVMVEGILRGFYPVGNELNIIADRFYGAKNGFRRKVTTHPGLTEFRDNYGIPKVQGEAGAIIETKATWKLNGHPDSIERTFAVKGDKYAGADSYTGKATRKLLAAVWERISGTAVPEGEAEEVNVAAMKPAEGREVESPELERWRMDCQATEEYNARLRKQGAPESDMEPLPPRPDVDEIPGLERQPERQPEKSAQEIPWREIEVTQFKSLKGKLLGSLDLDGLEKFRDWIDAQTQEKRAKLAGIDILYAAILKGIKELKATSEAPAKATPMEGFLNLMRGSGVTESAVLKAVREKHGEAPDSIGLLRTETIQALITAWPDILPSLK